MTLALSTQASSSHLTQQWSPITIKPAFPSPLKLLPILIITSKSYFFSGYKSRLSMFRCQICILEAEPEIQIMSVWRPFFHLELLYSFLESIFMCFSWCLAVKLNSHDDALLEHSICHVRSITKQKHEEKARKIVKSFKSLGQTLASLRKHQQLSDFSGGK